MRSVPWLPDPLNKMDPLVSAIARSRRRLLPFLLLMYVVAFLDRANIGFAKLALQQSAGISEAAYAWGAGLFFLPYALFEVPSNLMLGRVGARLWMSRIMVSWGVVSACMMFVHGSESFYTLRFLLGAAEAGFFPGVIFYLASWFPSSVRGEIFGYFYLGAPLALIFGGPFSGLLLHLHSVFGLQGWQWLFLIEGMLAVAVGIWSFAFLCDSPAEASWLTASEQSVLSDALAEEAHQRRRHGPSDFLDALRDRNLVHFAIVYLLIQMAVYGVVFYLPAQVSLLLHKSDSIETGFVSAIPWVCALFATLAVSRYTVKRRQKIRMSAVVILVVCAGAGLLYSQSRPLTAITALCVGASGLIAVQPLFWSFPTSYLSDRAAAGGIAVINAIGAIGGFAAANIKAQADLLFHSPRAGLYVLSAFTLVCAFLTARFRINTPSILDVGTASGPVRREVNE